MYLFPLVFLMKNQFKAHKIDNKGVSCFERQFFVENGVKLDLKHLWVF